MVENVPGLLSVNDGAAYMAYRWALKAPTAYLYREAGARYNLSVRVVSCADLGVAQLRKRLIVMGIRRDLGLQPPITPTPFRGRHVTVSEALDAEPIAADAPNHGFANESATVRSRLHMIAPGHNYSDIPEGHALSIKGKISHVYRRLDPDRPAYTVTANGGGGTHGYHHREPRRLTNREQARLQSFPDSFVFANPDASNRYSEVARRQIGNAVPPIAGRVILDELTAVLASAGIYGAGDTDIAEARAQVIAQGRRLGVVPETPYRSVQQVGLF